MTRGGRRDAARRGLGMLVVMIGVLVSAVDGTIVVLALPTIEQFRGLGARFGAVRPGR